MKCCWRCAEYRWNAEKSGEADYEIQFGYIRRPMHGNTSWDAAPLEVRTFRVIPEDGKEQCEKPCGCAGFLYGSRKMFQNGGRYVSTDGM
ncbi:glycoside hydrolase family 38 C-terminal domain-containing protein [Lachnoclostridium sp. Marseille-P6806]|uniref:glycoside hydrolase family 38 C-terminal domain-containing protein n=1 Tax=Lachnoclostridium sp. Marseille-P6806 TaxID=2364793 RepID=UPI0013EF58A5